MKRFRKASGVLRLILLVASVAASTVSAEQNVRRLPVKKYRDRMRAAWVGQMVGVTWGLPLEFRFNGEMVPESMVPRWDPAQINDALSNDDIWMDSVHLYVVDQYGLDVTSRESEIERSLVWGPNSRLLSGMAPPDTFNPRFRGNRRPRLGYQISADVTGLIAPGLPNTAIKLGEALTDPYGDGLYAGQFVGAMYAEAFFEESPEKIIRTALKAVPPDSGYAAMVRDVLQWHQENPADWQKTWQRIHEKYEPELTPEMRDFGLEHWNMEVRINGAFVLLGLLYGNGDLDKTMIISMRAGDDADCNPASAAGVLFTTLGYSKLPDRFQYPIDEHTLVHYSYGNRKGVHTYPQLLELTEKWARQAVAAAGGRIEKDPQGEELFVIPVQDPTPSKLYQFGEEIPVEHSQLTREELAKVRGAGPEAEKAFRENLPGWSLAGSCEIGFQKEIYEKENVIVTYPPDEKSPCTLSKEFTIPAGEWTTILHTVVSHARDGAWTLRVKVDGKEVFHKNVVKQPPWMHGKVDLTPYAGKTIKLELIDQPHPYWDYPWAYWGQIALESTLTTGSPRRLGFWDNARGDFKRE